MNIFKLLSIATGTVVTIGAAYSAQKQVDKILKDRDFLDDEPSSNVPERVITAFVVTTAVGGLFNSVINRIF